MTRLLALAIIVLLAMLVAPAQDYSIDWYSVDGGGGRLAGEGFLLDGTAGQPDAGTLWAPDLDLYGGFWAATLTGNRAPLDITLTPTRLAQSAVAAGAPAGTLATADPDAGDAFVYTLASGIGDADNACFTIAGDALAFAPEPAFELKTSYQLHVRSTDLEGLFVEIPFIITVCPPLSAVALTADAGNTALTGSAQSFHATPTGGVTPEYAFGITLRDILPDGSTVTQTIQAIGVYGANDTLTFTPVDPGRYTITVWCRESGTTAPRYIKSIAYNIGTPTLTGITGMTTNRPSGTAMDAIPVSGIRLTAAITGTGVGAQYFFSGVLKDGQADGSTVDVPVTMSTAWGVNAYYWHPTEPGTYLLTVQARDASCNISFSKTVTFLLRATELKSLSSIGFTPPYGTALNKLPASGILLRAYIVGTGTGNEYLFTGRLRVTNPDGSITYVPVEMGTAWQASRDYYWHPAEPGVYNIIVYGRDATCNTSLYKSITYLVKPPL